MSQTMDCRVVTIDGPAGAGKSTVARKLARTLAFVHVNSGGLYRAVGVLAEQRGLSLCDDKSVSELAREIDFTFKVDSSGQTQLLVDGVDFSNRIYQESVGELASQVGTLPGVRQLLTEVQRRVADSHSLVIEGRDAGSVVFPGAQFKFYLDADLEVRAKRRLLQFQELAASAGESVSESVEDITREMQQRDERDSTREISPQVQAEDAVYVDTNHLTVDEVVDRIVKIITESQKDCRTL